MTSERWNQLSVSAQLVNIGGEIDRAVRNRAAGKNYRDFLNKAEEWLALSKQDPKNVHRILELQTAEEELKDYFDGTNEFHNDDQTIMTYWDSFLSSNFL